MNSLTFFCIILVVKRRRFMKEDIFKKAEANFDKLRKYGFVQNNGVYQYRKKLIDKEWLGYN